MTKFCSDCTCGRNGVRPAKQVTKEDVQMWRDRKLHLTLKGCAPAKRSLPVIAREPSCVNDVEDGVAIVPSDEVTR